MTDGTRELALVLHAHLPWVRHDGEDALEERWLFEAVIECYLPLVAALERLDRDGVPGSLVVSLSPTLVAMLRDEVLRERFEKHFAKLEAFAAGLDPPEALAPALAFHRARLASAREAWTRWGGDLVRAFASLRETRRVSLWTCAYPHPLLPLWVDRRWLIDASIARAISSHRDAFGSPPAGLWLPECGYAPGLDVALSRHGVRCAVLETHGVLHGSPRPSRGVARPVRSPAGVVFAGRDPHAATEVWSREVGYPGDAVYQDFGSDLGAGPRDGFGEGRTGLRCWAVTDRRGGAKGPYDPIAAGRRAIEHAEAFVDARARALGAGDLSVAPFDCELFGHWWGEGVGFLEGALRAGARRGELRCVALDRSEAVGAPALETVAPAASTWGEGGHLAAWLEGSAGAMARELDRMARALEARGTDAPPAALEALLDASASDWPFLLKEGRAPHYARRRFDGHRAAFWRALGRELARAT